MVTEAATRSRRGEIVAWFVLVVAATIYFGLPGHIAHFVAGDLGYHEGVAWSMSRGDLNGTGPYAGLPSYFGGVFPLLWSILLRFGVEPGVAISALSWLEPAAWIAAAAFLARGLWRDPVDRVAFGVLLLVAGGLSTSEIWVDSPLLTGQVFWPLYPRDLTLMLLFVALGYSVRERPIAAGIAGALAMATQFQIGILVVALMAGALLLKRVAFTRVLLAVGVSVVGSAWWWMPRVLWTLRWGGTELQDYSGREPFHLVPSELWSAFGPLLILGALGAVAVLRKRAGTSGIFLLSWFAVAAGLVVAADLVETSLLPVRRMLLLSSAPLLGLAVEGLRWLRHLARVSPAGRSRPALPRIAAGASIALVLGTSLPNLTTTRSYVDARWATSTYGRLAYDEDTWRPVWDRLERDASMGSVLVAERDAPLVWFRTGRTPTWMKRPGFVKVGFNVEDATGWSERDREQETNSAFLNGIGSLCALAVNRAIDEAMFRSQDGLLGVYDWVPAQAARHSTDNGDGIVDEDRNSYDLIILDDHQELAVPFAHAGDLREIAVWYRRRSGVRPQLYVDADGTGWHTADNIDTDGTARRAVFRLPNGAAGPIRLMPDGQVDLLRVVGYVESAAAGPPPATVVSMRDVCR